MVILWIIPSISLTYVRVQGIIAIDSFKYPDSIFRWTSYAMDHLMTLYSLHHSQVEIYNSCHIN